MDAEKIIIDVPQLEGSVSRGAPQRKSLSYLISRALMVIFIITSILVHTAIIANAVEYFKTEGHHLLFSHIFPRYEKSEPMIPPLPEGNTVKEDSGVKNAEIPFPVRICDLSANAENGLSLTNETQYSPDLSHLLGIEPSSDHTSSPKVLIYHSHATEGYIDCAGTSFRTSDSQKNVVAIGKIIATVLESAGIETIHLTELFDEDDWSAAYDKSNAAVKDAISKDPSIQYVLDIHRDCIGNETDGYVSAKTKVFEKEVSQLMLVCGTDEGGSGHTQWRNNLGFAVRLQAALHSKYDSLMRPINLRRASFYQNTSPNALILECGTCANTIEEAKRSAVLFASSLADYIRGEENCVGALDLINALCP